MAKNYAETKAPPKSQPIWPDGNKIEILGVTGEHWTGKTVFITNIDPDNTIYYDVEKSGGSYSHISNRIDLYEMTRAIKGDDFQPVDLFLTWKDHAESIPPWTYTVCAVDPIPDLEQGMADWVARKHKAYGYSSMDSFRKMGGVFWGAVKNEWKSLLVKLSDKFQTFAFSAQLRTVWKGDKPTGKKEASGKNTLFALASLYLELEKVEGQNEPRGIVKKSRLMSEAIRTDTGSYEFKPLLPPTIPKCTPDVIRSYMSKGGMDYKKLKAAEKPVHREMSEEEKLQLEAAIQEDKRAGAETALEILNRQAELRSQQAEVVRTTTIQEMIENGRKEKQPVDPVTEEKAPKPRVKPDLTVEAEKPPKSEPKPTPKPTPQQPDPTQPPSGMSEEVFKELQALVKETGMSAKAFYQGVKTLLAKRDIDSVDPQLLTNEEATLMINKLKEIKAKQGRAGN